MKIPMTKEYEQFDHAMKNILKADPAKVKAQMEAEKKERKERKRSPQGKNVKSHAVDATQGD
jgi:hypothetical protein